MKTSLFLIMLFAVGLQGMAQAKYEKESRLKEAEVPGQALQFVDSLNFSSKVRWYQEVGLNDTSLEAKTKHNGKKYSIEFSADGSFEDVEIELKSHEIPAESFNKISKYLSEVHDRYSIQKVQVQYSGNSAPVLRFLLDQGAGRSVVTNYEIVVSCKLEGSFTLLEYLFSGNGDFIRKSQILLNRTDNIEF